MFDAYTEMINRNALFLTGQNQFYLCEESEFTLDEAHRIEMETDKAQERYLKDKEKYVESRTKYHPPKRCFKTPKLLNLTESQE